MKRVENNDLSGYDAGDKGVKSGKEKKRKQQKKERKEEKRMAKRSKSTMAHVSEGPAFPVWLEQWAERGKEGSTDAASDASGDLRGIRAWRKMAVQAGWPDAMAAVHGVLWWKTEAFTQDALMESTGVSRGSVHGALQALIDRGLAEEVEGEGKGKKRYRAVLNPGRLVEVLWLETWQRSLQGWPEAMGIWAQSMQAEQDQVSSEDAAHWRGWADRAQRLSEALDAWEESTKQALD